MLSRQIPWLELAVILPCVAAFMCAVTRDPRRVRPWAIFLDGLALICAILATFEYYWASLSGGANALSVGSLSFSGHLLVLDQLNAPLVVVGTLVGVLVLIATPATKANRFPVDLALLSQACTVASVACLNPWGVIGIVGFQAGLPIWEMRRRNQNIRPYLLHMVPFVACLVSGWALIQCFPDRTGICFQVGTLLLLFAVVLRNGCFPLHCWIHDLCEKLSFGTAILFLTPMVAATLLIRLLLPVASVESMHLVVYSSLLTAIYAAAMALIQSSPRSFFGFLLLSHMSMVFVGIEVETSIGMTGALCSWLSVSLSLTGFGLVLRSIEARLGRLSLEKYHGLYSHVPTLASFFLLTGLASIGFPGTIGFVGTELVIEGGIELHPWAGALIVVATALNGIAILQGYFRIFTGTTHGASVSLASRPNELLAVWAISLLILLGGVFPQPGVTSRYEAATEILRNLKFTSGLSATTEGHEDLPPPILTNRIDGREP